MCGSSKDVYLLLYENYRLGGSRMKKWKIASICMLIMVMLFTAACSNSSSNGNNGASNNGGAGNETNQGGEEAQAESAELKVLFPSGGEPPGLPADVSEHPTFQYVQQQTNTELDIEIAPNENYLDRLQRLVASGDYPDMVKIWVLEDYPGARESDPEDRTVMVLNDLIDEHGPNLKKHIPQELWDNASLDGDIMFIPKPQVVSNHNRATYIRKDWLERVGMEAPTTLDEYLEVMKAFRDQDANGNGDPNDEWATSARANFHWTSWIWFGAYDALPTTWKEVDGVLLPAEVRPGMKDALAWMRMMYEEKLLDPEFISLDQSSMDAKVFNDRVGIVGHLATSLVHWTDNIKKVGPEAEFIPVPSPVGPTGTSGGIVTAPEQGGWVIPVGTENPENVVKMLDWFVSDEGNEFYENGVPGEDASSYWNIDFMKRPGHNEKVLATVFGEEYADLAQQTYDITTQEGISNQATAGIPELPHMGKFPEIEGYTPSLWQEYAVKIVTGEWEVDRYDEFIEKYYSMGGQQIIDEVNEWYQQNK